MVFSTDVSFFRMIRSSGTDAVNRPFNSVEELLWLWHRWHVINVSNCPQRHYPMKLLTAFSSVSRASST